MDYKEKLKAIINSNKTPFVDIDTFLKYFPELKESEDERIRKEMIFYFTEEIPQCSIQEHADKMKEFIAWLEKQGEHANFRNKIQVGDKVTRNQDGMLVNLSQLNRVAKKEEKQDEQNPAWSEEDEVEVNRIIGCLENLNVADSDILFKDINWLKSLRPQPKWKPNDAQMASITCAVRKMKESACYDSELVSLYQDLKKLREELL